MRSIAQTFQMPTIQAILPTIVPTQEVTRVNGQLGMVQSANLLIAPALGAMLFSIILINLLILLDVLGVVLGIGILMFGQIPANQKQETQLQVLHNTILGFHQLMVIKGLRYMTIIGAVFTLLYMPCVGMYPLMTMAYFHGSVGQAGLIEVVYSAGMLIGGTIIGLFGKWKNRMPLVITAFFIVGITTAISGFLPGNQQGFYWFILLNIPAGLANPYFNTLLMAMIQQSFSPEQLGRVLGVLNSLLNLTGPMGLVIAGPLADSLGVELLLIIAGVSAIAAGLASLLIPVVRNYDRQLQRRLKYKA